MLTILLAALSDIPDGLATLSALILALTGLIAYFLKAHHWLAAKLHNLRYRWRKTDPLYTSVLSLQKEFYPNGGTSLRDSLNRLEDGMTVLQRGQADHTAKQRMVAYTLEIGEFTSDPEGRVTNVSPYWTTITGINEEDAIGVGWLRAIKANEHLAFIEERAEAHRDGRDFVTTATVVNAITKQEIPVAVRSTAVRRADTNELLGWQGTFKVLDHG